MEKNHNKIRWLLAFGWTSARIAEMLQKHYFHELH
jgi:hypothetical protein